MFVPYFGYNFFPGFKKYLLGIRGFFGAGVSSLFHIGKFKTDDLNFMGDEDLC